MDSSSSTSKTSGLTGDDVSIIKGNGIRKDKALSWEKLFLRRVSNVPKHDEKSKDIRSKLALSQPLQVKFKDTRGLLTILQDFMDECKTSRPNQDSSPAIETLLNRINQWKPSCRLATITQYEFEYDIACCKSSNEAVIQRTVMMSIIDRWQLHELFVFNCEGQWKLNADHHLPTTARRQEVCLPKPDLAMFFRYNALTGGSFSDPYPNEIVGCLRPDGGLERCFPFFFIEVKKAASDLESAFRANVYSASQALYNIHVWMSQAQQEDIFFSKVRVFTMDLNAQEIKLRMHRAVHDEDNLVFHFDDILSIRAYNKDEACLMVRNILVEYVEKELYGILHSTFKEVSRQEKILREAERRQESKRKADLNTAQSSKRSRSRIGSVAPTAPALPAETISDTTSSFGASGRII